MYVCDPMKATHSDFPMVSRLSHHSLNPVDVIQAAMKQKKVTMPLIIMNTTRNPDECAVFNELQNIKIIKV